MTTMRGRLCLPILMLAMFASGAATGNPKLDAHLLVAQAEQQRISALKPAERIKAAAAVADLEVLIRFEGDGVAKIRAAGGMVRSVLGNIASVTLPASALEAVVALPEVIYLEVPPPPVKRLNVSVPATRASLLRTGTAPNWTGNVGTGAGVIVGVIDDGIAFRHQDFRNPDGSTRIIELWDQRATGAAGTPPAGYAAGGVCDSAAINAVFAGNDLMALGALQALREAGRRVPEDLALVGFDDVPFAASTVPALTTVRQPIQQAGQLSAEMLIDLIENPQLAPQQLVLPTELVIRASCGFELQNALPA